MKTETLKIDLNELSSFTSERYEVISSETLSNCFHKDLNVSGSLLSLSTFENVTFFGCIFFGSRFAECTFKNCKFVGCEFKFLQMENCTFIACEFEANEWLSSSLRENEFLSTQLDYKTAVVAAQNVNKIKDCYNCSTLNNEFRKTA